MKWFHFILSHSIFIAICAAALVWQTTLLLHLDHPVFVYGFAFFATICSYNFYWILSKSAFASTIDLSVIVKNESTTLGLMLVAAAGMTYCFYQSGLTLKFVLPAFLLTLLYAVPLLPFRFLKFTRKAGVLKTILLAFTWAYVTVLIPVEKSSWLLNSSEVFVFTRRFLFMLMLCIIFDNRDKAVDKIRGLHSLATDLSPGLIKLLVFVIFAVLFGSNFFYKNYYISFSHSLALQISTLALLAVYFYSAKKRSYLFYYFIVDGLMLFSALATGIASI